MKMLSQTRKLAAVNPMGTGSGPEYTQNTLVINAQKVPVPAGQSAKSAMLDGPFGGKVKA
jgi:hypothetical protein